MVGISGSVMDTAGRTDWVVLRMSEPPRALRSTAHAENRTSAAVDKDARPHGRASADSVPSPTRLTCVSPVGAGETSRK